MGGKDVNIRSGWESHGRNSLPPGGHDGFVVIEDVRRDLREQLWREKSFFLKECYNTNRFSSKTHGTAAGTKPRKSVWRRIYIPFVI